MKNSKIIIIYIEQDQLFEKDITKCKPKKEVIAAVFRSFRFGCYDRKLIRIHYNLHHRSIFILCAVRHRDSNAVCNSISDYLMKCIAENRFDRITALTGARFYSVECKSLFELPAFVFGKATSQFLFSSCLNNSENGYCRIGKRLYFYKLLSLEKAIKELSGYISLCGYYPTPHLARFVVWKDKGILFFEYSYDFGFGLRTLYDEILRCERKEIFIPKYKLNRLLNCYSRNKDSVAIRKHSPIDSFYEERISERLISWYWGSTDAIFRLRWVINGHRYNITLMEIFKETASFFSQNREKLCILSQGDFNETNISLAPQFVDFSTSGYNDISGEAAVGIWSIFLGSALYYPKYHSRSYMMRAFDSEVPNITIDFQIAESVTVNINYIPTLTRRNLLREYYYMFKNIDRNCLNIHFLKYYLIMRICCVIDVNKMERCDQILAYAYAVLFFSEEQPLWKLLFGEED